MAKCFFIYIIDKLYFSRLLCFKVFTQIKDGFISTTVSCNFIYLLWSSTMVGCNDYIVILLGNNSNLRKSFSVESAVI